VIKFWKELETELKLRGFSNQTIKSYIYHNQHFFNFVCNAKTKAEYQKSLVSKGFKRTPQDITNADLKAFLAFLLSDRAYSHSSVNLAISAIKFYYQDVLNRDILKGIKHQKREKKLPVVLTKAEIKRMLEATKNRKHYLLIALLYSTGLRVSEAVNMRINDLQLEEKQAFVKYGKGKKERFVKLSNRFIASLKSYLKKRKNRDIYLFSYKGKPLSTRQAQRIVKKAAKEAGIVKKVFCHALRSSYATHQLDAGLDIRIIQELLGHADLSTTQMYTKVSKKRLMDVKSPLDSL
jgi:integrase/recombinase XerD